MSVTFDGYDRFRDMNEGRYIVQINGKILDMRDKTDGPALWRRVSSDDFYIIKEDQDHDFIVGTQNEDQIERLLTYINGITDSGLHPERDVRITTYPYKERNLKVVPRSLGAFIRIYNRHMFTDKHRVRYMENYNC